MTKRHYFAILLFLLILLGAGLYWYGSLDRPQVQMLALQSPATYETVIVDEPEKMGELEEFSTEGNANSTIDVVQEEIRLELQDKTPVNCIWVGDGFTPRVAGDVTPMGMVEYDTPIRIGGYNDIILPLDPQIIEATDNSAVTSVCITLMYDIGADGVPLNVTVYEVAPAIVKENDYYIQQSLEAVRELRWEPGRRNGKAVRINQNTISVRFGAN